MIRKNWLLLLGYGTVGFTAFNAFLYSALQYTSAINAVIEQAGIPMVIFVLNYLLFRTAFLDGADRRLHANAVRCGTDRVAWRSLNAPVAPAQPG